MEVSARLFVFFESYKLPLCALGIIVIPSLIFGFAGREKKLKRVVTGWLFGPCEDDDQLSDDTSSIVSGRRNTMHTVSFSTT